MSLYAEFSTDIKVYEDSSRENCKFALAIGDRSLSSTFTYESSSRVRLAAGAIDTPVSFQTVSDAYLVVMKSNSKFSFKVNGPGDNTAITLEPRTDTQTTVVTPAFIAMLASGIVSIYLSNPSLTTAIEVDIGIAGV